MVILSKGCKPDSFESHNSLKLSFTNIRVFRSNFVDCESFLESNSPDILALCETNLGDSIDCGNVSVRGYLPFIRKDSTTHMHGLAIYVTEGLSFARDLSLENSANSYLCFRLALLHSVSNFFFIYRSPSLSLCTLFDSISCNIDEALRWLTFLLRSQTVILTVLLFFIYFFLPTLLFALQWFSLYWEILIMFL